MNCQKCNSERIFSVGGKSRDLNDFSFQEKEGSGYLPEVKNLCGDDYFELDVCLECGQVQGKFPVEDPEFEEEYGG